MEITVNIFGIETSKRFEDRIGRFIKDELEFYKLEQFSEVTLEDAGIRRVGGYGQYEKYVNMFIGNEEFILTKHTTDSELFDFFRNQDANRTYSNAMKRLVMDVMESRFEQVIEEINY